MIKLMRLAALLLLMLGLWVMIAHAQDGGKEILVIDVDGPVTPVMLSYIQRAITEADTRQAEALVIRLNTPGGSVDLTRQIIQAIIASNTPVVVYIWPSGGHAASAGTFITLAGHAAAMAPNTSIGAASPVNENGGDIDTTMKAKIENILVAEIKNLSNRRGDKAITWAQEAITKAKAATAQEALELGVIDFVAKDMDDLRTQLDGFKVKIHGQEVTLATREASFNFLQATPLEDFLSIITNPSIALLLISLGTLGIVYEFMNPGGYMAGVIGLILLLVGLYGMGQLPVNYAGLFLIMLAFALFIAEFFVHSLGALTAAGVVSFIIGALILFNTAEFAYRLPLPSIIGIPLALAAIFGLGIRKVWQALKRPPTTGAEGLLGAIGVVKVALEPSGSVLVWGERWQAVSQDKQPIPVGAKVKVTAINGMQVQVQQVAE
jgi:membrane-bound serine protease (ClpP class)